MATIPSCSDGDLPASDRTMLLTVTLAESDIPGAILTDQPYNARAYRWWLLCRGVKAPTSWKKNRLLSKKVSIYCCQALFYFILSLNDSRCQTDKLPIVDVDGSYLYRKHK